MHLLYLIYIWSGVIGLASMLIVRQDKLFWKKISKNVPQCQDIAFRDRVMMLSSLIPFWNTLFAAVMLVFFYVRWAYREGWYD